MGKKQQQPDLEEEQKQTSADEQPQEKTLEQQCQEYELGWKRALADYENLKRDMSQQADQSRKRIKANFAQSLLPVIDNFLQAVHFAPNMDDADPQVKNWFQGVMFIEKQFTEVMAQLGLQKIKTVGEPFDPHKHEAASEETDASQADGIVLKEVVAGWEMEDYVLRPAKVIINKNSK